MTADLESRVSRALHGAHVPPLAVDPAAAVAEGRRTVCRRRATVAGMLAAALLAGGVWTAAQPDEFASVQVPATGPTGSSRVEQERCTMSAGASMVCEAGKAVITWTRQADSTGVLRVELKNPDGTTRRLPERTLPVGGTNKVELTRLGGGEFLVTAPAGARSVSSVTRGTIDGTAGPDLVRLGDSGLAVGLLYTSPEDAPRVVGMRWRMGDEVHSTTGASFRTARVPGTDQLVWTDDTGRHGLMGGDTETEWRGHRKPGVVLLGGPRVGTRTTVALVPTGSSAVTMDWPAGWKPGPTRSVPLPGGGALVVTGSATNPDDTGAALPVRVSWTDPDGHRRSAR